MSNSNSGRFWGSQDTALLSSNAYVASFAVALKLLVVFVTAAEYVTDYVLIR